MTERKASMGDKVYRGDVIKFIRNNITLGTFMKRTVKTANEACWDLCDKLNYVPAIEENPEPHWIPVTEQPPEVGKSVLICDAYGDMIIWRKCRMKRNFSHLYRMTLTHIEEKIWLNWSGSLMIHRAMQKIFYKKQK